MKILVSNKPAKYNYQIENILIAGIVLTGQEVKSLRQSKASLKGSYVTVQQGELWLINAYITPYSKASSKNYDPEAPRKLLVTKTQLSELIASKQNGKQLIPLAIGIVGRYIKLEIGIGSSRKRHDKREVIKKREFERRKKRL